MISCNKCQFNCSHIFDNCGCDCLCSRIQETKSYYQQTTISIIEYKEAIYDSLALAEPCGLPDGFMNSLDCWWNLYSQRRCGNDLVYLYVRGEGIKFLLAANVWQVDRSDATSTSDSRTDAESKQESETQAQQNNHSSSYGDSIGQARYSDLAESTLRAESQRTAHSETHDVSERDMDDEGHGDGFSDTDADRRSRSNRESLDESESVTAMYRYGAKRGGEYTFSQSQQRGNATNLGIAGFDRNASRSSSDYRMRSDSSDSSYERRFGTSDRILFAEAVGWSNSARTSSSFFQNDMIDNSWGVSDAESHDASRSESNQVSEAAGAGNSATNTRGRGSSQTQATEQSHGEGFTTSESQSHSQGRSDFAANSQRFDHLMTLLEANKTMIELVLARRRANAGYSIGRMIFGNKFGLCGIDIYGGPIEARKGIRDGGVNGIICCPEQPAITQVTTQEVNNGCCLTT